MNTSVPSARNMQLPLWKSVQNMLNSPDGRMFIQREKTAPQHNICNGKPHARILQRDHNIKGFKK